MSDAHVESYASLFQKAHGASSRIKPERASAREHDRVNLLNGIEWIQKICFASPGRGASNIDPGNCAVFSEYDGAAGWSSCIGEVTDFDPRDIGNRSPLQRVIGRFSGIAEVLAEDTNADGRNCTAQDFSTCWSGHDPSSDVRFWKMEGMA